MRVADESLLSDDLLRQLVAVGHVDVLVGIPTLNNATTVVDVVRAAQAGIGAYFPRARSLIFNADSGSDDGTPALVRDATTDDTGTVTASRPLRTTQRITTPYHGLPGKGSALRMIFAVADLLSADAIVALDPDVTSLTPDWIPALVRPVRDGQADIVGAALPARGGRRPAGHAAGAAAGAGGVRLAAAGAVDGRVRLLAAVCQSLPRASGVGQRRHPRRRGSVDDGRSARQRVQARAGGSRSAPARACAQPAGSARCVPAGDGRRLRLPRAALGATG